MKFGRLLEECQARMSINDVLYQRHEIFGHEIRAAVGGAVGGGGRDRRDAVNGVEIRVRQPLLLFLAARCDAVRISDRQQMDETCRFVVKVANNPVI